MGSFVGPVWTARSARSFAIAEIRLPAGGISITPLTEPEQIKLPDGQVLLKFTGPMRVEGATIIRYPEIETVDIV